MPVYRPTCRVRVQLRLDELDDTAGLAVGLERGAGSPSVGAALPATKLGVDQALGENFQSRQRLNQGRSNVAPGTYRRELARLDTERGALLRRATGEAGSQERPLSLEEDASQPNNVIFDLLPTDAQVARHGIQDAGTVEISLDYRDLPIDPRIVRACLVSVVLGTVNEDDYAEGVIGLARQGDGSLLSLVSREPGQEIRLKSTSRFVGFVDYWYTEHTEDGDSVRLSGRDVSALLRDLKLPQGQVIDLTKPIVAGVKELIDKSKMTRGFQVFYGAPLDPLAPTQTFDFDPDTGVVTVRVGELGPIPADSAPRTSKSRGGKAQKSARRGDHEESMWDHIAKTVIGLGLVPVVRGFALYLLQPRTFNVNDTKNRRKMLWGGNLKRLGLERKLGGITSPTIEVRCADPTIGRTRWARYPVLDGEPSSGILGKEGSPQPVESRASKVSPNGTAQDSVQIHTVRGVTDLAVLERVAANTHEMIGRQELQASFTTDDLESFDSEEETDLLDLQPGDPVELLVARPASQAAADAPSNAGETATMLQRIYGQSVAERAAYLRGLGFAERVAQTLAQAQEQARLLPLFRTKNVNLTFSVGDGVTIEADVENYIFVREDTDTRRVPK